ncbi:cobalamin-binding protein [Candidatus Nitrotoga sp. M5]|uniref:cobalamin-binding protein n=1 Tax=Candidatus Nitrotoga sp. M5 TaxID=2890409 RepID=UPI001EF63C11|nr:cobalamin-binding protein [Candidatus Nitrotoga sp. M5]CAH1387373.1 Cobalamin-binding protein [Candidatus Nitrotoga sp. M5]
MNSITSQGPQRIVCLTEETTVTLYLLGEQDRIVGISGFTVRPPQARKEKPKVSAFTSAKIDKILALNPDLVLGFSDMQADIAAQLIRAGIAVHVFNQRSVAGILDMISLLGSMVCATEKTQRLIAELREGLADIERSTTALSRRPRIYFEEWDEPLISGIRWVSELIHIAGGENCFAELAASPAAKGRIITDPEEVIRRAPDIIIGSWCGKRFDTQQVCERSGWGTIPAVHNGYLHEIKSCDILQPGPTALTDGVRQLHAIVQRWAESQ